MLVPTATDGKLNHLYGVRLVGDLNGYPRLAVCTMTKAGLSEGALYGEELGGATCGSGRFESAAPMIPRVPLGVWVGLLNVIRSHAAMCCVQRFVTLFPWVSIPMYVNTAFMSNFAQRTAGNAAK